MKLRGDYFESLIGKASNRQLKEKKRREMPSYISVLSTIKQNKFSNTVWKLVEMKISKYI